MSTVETLQRAKYLIETHGWTQGEVGSRELGFCAVGAVSKASLGFSADYFSGVQALNRTLAKSVGVLDVIRYNDQPGRTKEEVLDLFDRTIERLTTET